MQETEIDYKAVIPFLNGFDDDYLNALLQGNKEGIQQLLRTVLRIPDLIILKNPNTQQYLKNIYGRSICMDCYAESLKKRFNASLMDAGISVKGEDYDDLPDTYVIFITEHDIYKAGKPYYEIERVVKTLGIDFNDGSHILYVNGEYEGDNPIGWLMHDLHCTNPHDMHEGPLKERALYLKETKEGVRQMSEIGEKIHNDGIKIGEEKARQSNAKEMLLDGYLSVQQIAKYSGLSEENIEKLKSTMKKSRK